MFPEAFEPTAKYYTTLEATAAERLRAAFELPL